MKREVETFSGRTEDFNLTYVSWNWGLHIITDKIEDFFGKSSSTIRGIHIELSHNGKWSGDIVWQNWSFHVRY